MQIREHIIALTIHFGIIVCVGILVLATSCGTPEPEIVPDPVGDFFKTVQEGLDEAGAENVIVLAVLDNANVGEDKTRQVYQDIQTQLDRLKSVVILEQPSEYMDELFTEVGVDPASGISSEHAIALAEKLSADALILASIETSAPDVYMKIYASETGAIVFSETLQAWPLPITDIQDDPFADLLNSDLDSETPPPAEGEETEHYGSE